jgi:hypothetical protein
MENLGEVAAWHAGLEPTQQMAWAHPSTVFLHCPIFKEPKIAKQSLTALEAFEVMKKGAPKEFLDAHSMRRASAESDRMVERTGAVGKPRGVVPRKIPQCGGRQPPPF